MTQKNEKQAEALPFTVVAGKIEGGGERNYKYIESFADVMDAVRALDAVKGYHFAEIEYRPALVQQPQGAALAQAGGPESKCWKCGHTAHEGSSCVNVAPASVDAIPSASHGEGDEMTPPEILASRLIDAWCDTRGEQIPWAKAVEISAVCTKMADTERARLLALDDDAAPASSASPAALTDYSYQQLFDAIAAATRVTSGTGHIAISVIDFRAALLAAQPAEPAAPAEGICSKCGYPNDEMCFECDKPAAAAHPDRQGVALSEQERDSFVGQLVEYGTEFAAPLYAVVEKIERAILSRASSSRAEVEIPEDVRNWHTAWQAHIDATATYNARVAFARANEGERIGSISCQAEYELMHDAKNKVMRTLPELFAGISAMLAAAEAPNGETGDA